nr:hypothetical protein [Tanacetum cinerariifolium]
MIDEENAKNLQDEFDEEERITREKAKKELEANIALIEEWMIFKQRLMLIINWLKDCKQMYKKTIEEKRNKPPTQAQQRKIMCTDLKNVERMKLKDLKNKSFDSIQKMFDSAFNRVNTSVDFRTELVEGSSRRAGEELTHESAKKQKVNDDKETIELKQLMKIIHDEEEVAIDDI